MHWAWLSLTSAFFLGFYDICQKHALRGNSVVQVLMFSTGTCASVWTALLLLQAALPGALPHSLLVPRLGLLEHAELLLAQPRDPPCQLALVGQVEPEAPLRRRGQHVPVVVQRRVDVQRDPHDPIMARVAGSTRIVAEQSVPRRRNASGRRRAQLRGA